jgi:hypothetical protein
MQRVPWLCVVVLAIASPNVSGATGERPFVTYTVDLNHPERSAPYPGDAELSQIARLVRSVPGIYHRIQEIHLGSARDAEVRTGRRASWNDPRPDHGDKLYLQKRDGKWRVIRKTKWSYEGNGGLFRETP